MRDYIHVMDLARGHPAALKALHQLEGAVPINLRWGQGYSVLEMVRALSEVVGRPLPYVLTGRRPGDIACCYAEVARAEALLGWKVELDLAAMCREGGLGRRHKGGRADITASRGPDGQAG